MRFAAILALALIGRQDTGEQFFKFKVGTTWVFEQTEEGKVKKMTLKVTKEEGGKVYVESSEERGDDKEPRIENLVWYVEDGILTLGEIEKEGTKPIFRVYKIGSRKGDKWKSSFGGGQEDMDVTHLGTEELTVPAGKYKDVVHVQMAKTVKAGDEERTVSMDFYLVPAVGLVKLEINAGKDKNVIQLKEFKAAK
ncbi:MAG: hypothetical protein HYY17_10590 [Planctomycetes bacterium]|nr:hypothetical protein [Planctomycetota bacterium]